MKTKLGFFILGVGLVLTLSCTKYPPSSDRLLEDLAVITQYDTKADFNTYKTYNIANTITKITDKDTSIVAGQIATDVLNQIDKNMKARGFVPAATGEIPDLGLQVTYFQNTNVYVYYYDYWGWYYPYYGYYYPTYYSTYTTGLAAIEIIDLKNGDNTNHRASIVWNGYIRGLLTSGHSTYDITNSIDQAFIQTPQLVTTAK